MTKQYIINEIKLFKNLPYDWDGYESLSISELTYTNSLYLIYRMPDDMIEFLTDVYPNPNDTISMIWELYNNIFNLEIGYTTFSYYIQKNNHVVLSSDVNNLDDYNNMINDYKLFYKNK